MKHDVLNFPKSVVVFELLRFRPWWELNSFETYTIVKNGHSNKSIDYKPNDKYFPNKMLSFQFLGS